MRIRGKRIADFGLRIGDRPAAAKYAKRTQFRADEIPRNSTTLSFHHSRSLPIVRNEPNSVESNVRNEPNFRWRRTGRGHRDVGQSCETNPICSSLRGTGILPVDRNHGRDAHATTPTAQDETCKTNPISDGVARDGGHRGRRTRGNRAKRTQFRHPPCWDQRGDHAKQGQLLPWKVSGEDAQPTKSRGRVVRNEANFPATPGGPGPEGRGAGANCAKRSQFGWSGGVPEGEMCETNPIPGGAGRASLGARPSDHGLPPNRLCKTNPISGLPAGTSAGDELCKTKPIARSGAPRRCPPSGRSRGGRISTGWRRKCGKIKVWSLFQERVGDVDEKAVPLPAWVVDGRLCGLAVVGAARIWPDDHRSDVPPARPVGRHGG